MTEYKIVSSFYKSALQKTVNFQLKKDWVLKGELIVTVIEEQKKHTMILYTQVMVKP